LLFKERRPFKLKKEYPSEQWQIISFRLIPLKTPVSFCWTSVFLEISHKKIRGLAKNFVNDTAVTISLSIFFTNMKTGPRWSCLMKKTGGQKSHVRVP
jgi:hypothetical protein